MIGSKIVLAQTLDEPHSINGLARLLQMPRSTLRDLLHDLEALGMVEREHDRLVYSGQRLASAGALALVEQLRQLIIDAGEELKWTGD